MSDNGSLALTKNGKLSAVVRSEFTEQEQRILEGNLTEQDKKYLRMANTNIGAFATIEKALDDEIKEVAQRIRESDDMKKLRDLKVRRKQVRAQYTAQVSKMQGVLEAALSGYRRGEKLVYKLLAIMKGEDDATA